MRKHYLDNLRTIMILLLFPVHTFMIWNDFGTKFYVWGGENTVLSTLITLVNPWFMPVLFVTAGISARYSLEKRTRKAFVKERFWKLLVPFVGGMILLVPIQTLYARKFFFAFDGSVLENLGYFFTHVTDLSGYDGGFTPGHLWFILFLFLISLAALAVDRCLPLEKVSAKVENIKFIQILLLFVPVWLMYYLGNFGGYSLGKDLALYLLGYYIFSCGEVMEELLRYRRPVLALFAVSQLVLTGAYYIRSYYGDLLVNFTGWLGVLSCFILGRSWLDRETRLSRFFRKHSFGIYMLHQSILVALGYYILSTGGGLVFQVTAVLLGSLLLTVAACLIVSRIPYVSCLLGLRQPGRTGGSL